MQKLFVLFTILFFVFYIRPKSTKSYMIIDTYVPAKVIDEAIRRRQLELADQTLRHWEVLDVAMQ